jgi:hypothetical protein
MEDQALTPATSVPTTRLTDVREKLPHQHGDTGKSSYVGANTIVAKDDKGRYCNFVCVLFTEECTLRVTENKVLRKIFEPNMNEITETGDSQ